jgi:hypothetical protein
MPMIFWWKYKPVYSAVLTHIGRSTSSWDNVTATVVFLENGFGARELLLDGIYTAGSDTKNICSHPWYLALANPWKHGTLTLDDVQNGRSDDIHLFPTGRVTRIAGPGIKDDEE